MARAYGVEDASFEEEVSYAAPAETQEVVHVGTVWSIAHLQCRNRHQDLDTENEEDAGRGVGSSLGRVRVRVRRSCLGTPSGPDPTTPVCPTWLGRVLEEEERKRNGTQATDS